MIRPICKIVLLALVLAGGWPRAARAQYLDQIGVTLLRATTTNLDGSGIRVAQPEANTDSDTNHPSAFEVNPASVAQVSGRFAYFSAAGVTNDFPNLVGNESGHADGVAANFYGLTGQGVATNVAHVDNYDADFFVNDYVFNFAPMSNALVVNQSFIFGSVPDQVPISMQQAIDSAFDDYAATYKVLFVSGAGNSGGVCPPSTCYNGISVAAFGGSSSIGPTADNGRCKPDITAPADVTSFSTPLVSGAAAILMQAALRGDGGADTNSAVDMRTIKALLLNGAVKPVNWTNAAASPLDACYGAGVLNVFNSYEQLAGGKHSYIESTSVISGNPHWPGSSAANVPVLNGWDFNTNSSSASKDKVCHYYFIATNTAEFFMLTATLVWNRQSTETNLNDLNLFLYDGANSNLVTCSTSLVDNVEHLFVPRLAPGRYDLQVWKAGGLGIVSPAEPYALAWAFTSAELNVVSDGSGIALAWPAYPAGFKVETTTNLAAPVWNTNLIPVSVFTNGQNVLFLGATNPVRFFRLHQRP